MVAVWVGRYTAALGRRLAKGASGFFTGRDTGTEELAYEVSRAV